MTEDLDRLAAKVKRRQKRAAATLNKKKMPRKHHSPPAEDDDELSDEDWGMPTWKTGAVIAVIIACFAILYPKMFHPMLMFVLGMNKREPEPESSKYPHPTLGGRGFAPDPHIHAGGHHGAGGPHPGMRMAGSMGGAGTQAPTRSSGKGMWHWMLPFYTVGVIVFLLYTLSKILWKSPDKKSKKRGTRLDPRKRRLELEDEESSEEESSSEPENEEEKQGKLSNKELKGLQKRLNQTETAMQKILQQLECISGSVDSSTADNVKKMTMDTLTNLARVEASEMVEEVEQVAMGSSKRIKPKSGEEDSGYLQDLEKALSDFKKFTESYVQQHSQPGGATIEEMEDTGKNHNLEEDVRNNGVETDDADEEVMETENMEPEESENEEESEEEEEEEEEVSDLSEENSAPEGSEDAKEAEKRNQVTNLESHGDFDRMEWEDPENLDVHEPTGEIISLDVNGKVVENERKSPGKNAVRKRARKT